MTIFSNINWLLLCIMISYSSSKDKSSEKWIGMDFGEKADIRKIRFCPNTDKNPVWPGLTYELFYWDREWTSIGQRKAREYSITFDSPVSKTLYLLECLDEGKEKRIFTYEEGKQVWW